MNKTSSCICSLHSKMLLIHEVNFHLIYMFLIFLNFLHSTKYQPNVTVTLYSGKCLSHMHGYLCLVYSRLNKIIELFLLQCLCFYVNTWSTEGEVISLQYLFLAINTSDVTRSAVLNNQNTVYMPF